MKKVFFAALFTLSVSSLFANEFLETTPRTAFTKVNGSKPVDMTVRSVGGSTVRIIGTISYSLAPVGIPSFSGTVTVSGGIGPNGTITFAKDNKTLKMMFDNEDVTRLRTIRWSGTGLATQYATILNEAGINNSLVAIFNALA